MGVFNFKLQFAQRVRLGLLRPDHPMAKRSTIRAQRKDGRDPMAGETVDLYTGMRTAYCLKLGSVEILTRRQITIVEYMVSLDGHILRQPDLLALAKQDGFGGAFDFYRFFKAQHGMPFIGYHYTW